MKKIFAISALLLWCINIFSQDVVEIGGKEAGLKDFPKLDGIRNVDGVWFKTNREDITRENRSVYHVERYDNDLKLRYSSKVDFPSEKEEVEGIYFLEKEICLLSSLKDENNLFLYLTLFDKETGRITAKKKEVYTLKKDPEVKARMWFDIELSEDKSKLAVLTNLLPKKESCKRNVIIFDLPSFKQSNQFDLPGSVDNINIWVNIFYLSKDGQLYYSYSYDVKKDDPKAKSNTIVSLNMSTKASKSKVLDAGIRNIEVGYPKEFQKGNVLYYVGRFEESISKKEKKTGLFCKTIDLSDIGKSDIVYEYYPADIETKYSSRKVEFSEKNMEVIATFTLADGYYVVQNYRYDVSTSGQNATYVKSYSKDYFVSKFNNSGKREFIKVIPKFGAKSMYGEDILEHEGTLYFFYCDHPDNLDKYTLENFDSGEYKDVGDVRGPVPVCVKLSKDGKMERKTFERNEEWCYFPGYGLKSIKGDGIIVYRIKDQTYTLTEFRLKK